MGGLYLMNNKEIKKLEYGYTDYETEKNMYDKINEIIDKFNNIVNELDTVKCNPFIKKYN